MWPGQQPPGGEQNPQDQNPNPYQQPGYGQPGQQPNPHQHQPGYPGQQPGYQDQPANPQQPQYPQQQPGYPQNPPGYQQQPGRPPQQPPGYPPQPGQQQPNPYYQPTTPQYGAPGPGGPTPPGGKAKTTVVAIVAALAVVVAAGVTAFVVLGKDDDTTTNAQDDATSSASASKPAKPSPASSPPNPRGAGGAGAGAPQIAGWKVVTNPGHGTQFDVPPDWEVSSSTMISGFDDVKKDDGSTANSFSAPAFFKSKWCGDDPDKNGTTEYTSLAGVGTKGANGAKDTGTAAVNEAGSWAWAAFAQEEPEKSLTQRIKVSKAQPYTTKSGVAGNFATATATGITKKGKCYTDGKSIAFTFSNAKGDFTTWALYANTGVTGEVPDATVKKILSSVRLLKTS
jgi:hypothetical protein